MKAPPIVHDVLRASGTPLDKDTRTFMEPRFGFNFARTHTSTAPQTKSQDLKVGPAHDRFEQEADHVAHSVMHATTAHGGSGVRHDFSDVRLHTDARAAESARAVNAKAYTVGRDIVFADGQYSPHTNAGRELLAHELAHTIQQSADGAPTARLQRTIGDGHDLQSTRFSGNLTLEAAFDGETLIRRGQTSTAVRLIQESLLDQGYNLPSAGADGIFGPETEAAIRRFQTDAGAVKIDGIVGPETMGLLDTHDTTRPGGVGPVPLTGPLAGPRPAPARQCDDRFAGVTFALANQTGAGVTPAAAIGIAANPAGNRFLVMRGITPVTYRPDVTINAPSNAIAQEFEVGFIQNVLTTSRVGNYTGAHSIRVNLPTPIKDGAPLSSGHYHTIFVETTRAGVLQTFTGNGAVVNLRFPDTPVDARPINLTDEPACAAGTPAATLVDMTMRDTFRTWVAVRHRPSGCVRTLHHIDWDLLWSATVNTTGAVPTRTVTSNVINVTTANGNGAPGFIQGGRVPADVAGRVCA
jgi:hypothetical protein